jgi:hypothetical protein
VTNAVRSPVSPATLWIRVVSMASARVIAGRMVVSRRASLDWPAPEGRARGRLGHNARIAFSFGISSRNADASAAAPLSKPEQRSGERSQQLLQQRLGLLQVGSTKALDEPAVYLRQLLADFGGFALALPQVAQAMTSV